MFKTTFKDAVSKEVSQGSQNDTNAKNLPAGASGRTVSPLAPKQVLYCEEEYGKPAVGRQPGKDLKVL